MTATHNRNVTKKTDVLYLAFELGDTEWKLAFTIGLGQKPRLRSMPARDLPRLQDEIAKAKQRFHLTADAPVRSCYEAGRDGFWLDRYLNTYGIHNSVVDSSSIEVNRRQRRAKTDRLDACVTIYHYDRTVFQAAGQERAIGTVGYAPDFFGGKLTAKNKLSGQIIPHLY